jgi:hypothetical protein
MRTLCRRARIVLKHRTREALGSHRATLAPMSAQASLRSICLVQSLLLPINKQEQALSSPTHRGGSWRRSSPPGACTTHCSALGLTLPTTALTDMHKVEILVHLSSGLHSGHAVERRPAVPCTPHLGHEVCDQGENIQPSRFALHRV